MAIRRRPLLRPGEEWEGPGDPYHFFEGKFEEPEQEENLELRPPRSKPLPPVIPGLPPPDDSRSGETPRERPNPKQINFAPTRPYEPTPEAGEGPSVRRVPPPTPGGPIPFNPLAGPNGTQMSTASMKPIGTPSVGGAMAPSNRFFGSRGGLQGGGLGLPLDPTSDEASDPISTLIKKLLQGR